MNTNIFRTFLTICAAALLVLPVFFGCVAQGNGSFNCAASWLSPQFTGVIAVALMVLGMVVKQFDGTGLFTAQSTGFRTALTFAAIAVTVVSAVLGCSVDAITGAVNCDKSWLSPQLAAIAAGVFLGINQVVKAFDGTTLTKPVT